MQVLLNILIVLVGAQAATIIYHGGFTRKSLIFLGCIAYMVAMTLSFGFVDNNFWYLSLVGTLAGLIVMFPDRHTIPAQIEECWNNIDKFWFSSEDE